MVARNEEKVSAEKLEAATGRTHEGWHELMDAAGAVTWTHAKMAAWLQSEHGVDGWWAQGITISYEQARGLRLPGQQSDGTFAAGSSRTLPGIAAEMLARVIDAASAWAGSAPVASNAGAKRPSARWSLADNTGLEAIVSPVTSGAPGRVRVALTRTRLEGPDALADAKTQLASVLDTL